ncbi:MULTISPECIES: AraC family transcriptional regulator [Butyricimonas]|uniref:AraC family transcriptional regulator n=1 Tax=Butyricimonas hominis TaxID=2763032 RepID=A0ABR7D694_9BACT|nr:MULTISPECIES: AraC family transcriptional regulator [Butyricimonas]MBC5623314.1 AraC family transcriptional regulator [Butyricimonas hominis]MCB6972568.1 helix-turn-helix domain-containing protein [Butyricimonas synergistica]MCG4519577.1 helix-turn-helix domain-containing protein [Butyricimonas sp. DFI.6.44]
MYKEYQPHEILAPYIDKYWVMEGTLEPEERIKILPDGCTDFIFNLDESANLADQNGMKIGGMQAYFVGPMRAYSELQVCSEMIHLIGVRFTPCGLTVFTKIPMSEFTDQRVFLPDLDVLFNAGFAAILREKNTLKERLLIIERYLLFCLRYSGEVDKQVARAVGLMHQADGKIPVRELMEQVCLCQRHFERRFKHATGYTPKEYTRIVRFRRTMDVLRQVTRDNLFSVAIDCGYYDQSHLVKEFKRLSGSPPSVFASLPKGIPITYLDG